MAQNIFSADPIRGSTDPSLRQEMTSVKRSFQRPRRICRIDGKVGRRQTNLVICQVTGAVRIFLLAAKIQNKNNIATG